MDGYLPIGDRVRELRRRRGLSQLRFGALIDRSENWGSKAERGEIPIDRLSVLVRIAEALKVSPGELIADPRVSHDEAESPMRAGIAGVRRAVLVPPSPQRVRSLEELDAALIDANQVWNRVAITATLGLLPGLLGELDAAAREGNESAVRLLGQGYGFVSAVMTRLAEHDLAWVAVERSRMLAERLSDPAAIAHAGFRLVHVVLGAGRLEEAAQVADAALARADGDMGSARVRSLVGAIYLPLAVTAARRSDEATAFSALDEASRLADEVPQDVRFWTGFKPTNVQLHHVAVAVDLGNAGEALRVAETIDLSKVRADRRSRHLIDVAMAHSYRRDTASMIETLREVEGFAPEQLQNFPLVRELVWQALRKERGRPNADLHRIALRIGVA